MDLSGLLKDQRPGRWVILDPDMTRVIGSGRTPGEAMRKAGIKETMSRRTRRRRPVMMQVPDPTMRYF
jgi:hypothetical protein